MSKPTKKYSFGLLFRPASFWVGVHYSRKNKRFCMNLIPFFTFWLTKPDGITPNIGTSIFKV